MANIEKQRERARIYRKSYYAKNRDTIIQQSKDYQKKYPDKAKTYTDKWTSENLDHVKMLQRRSYNKRRKTDIQFKLKISLRTGLYKALKGNYKSGSAVRDLGCSVSFLKTYLEGQFLEGMTWENHGNGKDKWNIDHIYPLSRVNLTIREELLKVCHYTNLQPLWHIDNIKKGNRIK